MVTKSGVLDGRLALAAAAPGRLAKECGDALGNRIREMKDPTQRRCAKSPAQNPMYQAGAFYYVLCQKVGSILRNSN